MARRWAHSPPTYWHAIRGSAQRPQAYIFDEGRKPQAHEAASTEYIYMPLGRKHEAARGRKPQAAQPPKGAAKSSEIKRYCLWGREGVRLPPQIQRIL